MLTFIRELANAEAQKALRLAAEQNAQSGTWDSTLEDRYRAAERIVDAVDAALALEPKPDIALADTSARWHEYLDR